MFTIYYANTRNDPKNCRYPNRLTDLSDEALKEAFSHDYVCAEYKGNYRNAENFVRSTCLAFDVDNDHSDDPADWLTPEDLRMLQYAVIELRNRAVYEQTSTEVFDKLLDKLM